MHFIAFITILKGTPHGQNRDNEINNSKVYQNKTLVASTAFVQLVCMKENTKLLFCFSIIYYLTEQTQKKICIRNKNIIYLNMKHLQIACIIFKWIE